MSRLLPHTRRGKNNRRCNTSFLFLQQHLFVICTTVSGDVNFNLTLLPGTGFLSFVHCCGNLRPSMHLPGTTLHAIIIIATRCLLTTQMPSFRSSIRLQSVLVFCSILRAEFCQRCSADVLRSRGGRSLPRRDLTPAKQAAVAAHLGDWAIRIRDEHEIHDNSKASGVVQWKWMPFLTRDTRACDLLSNLPAKIMSSKLQCASLCSPRTWQSRHDDDRYQAPSHLKRPESRVCMIPPKSISNRQDSSRVLLEGQDHKPRECYTKICTPQCRFHDVHSGRVFDDAVG